VRARRAVASRGDPRRAPVRRAGRGGRLKRREEKAKRRGNNRRRRPWMGIRAYAQQVHYGNNDLMAGMLPMTYVRAIHAVGGRAVLITPDDPGADVLESLDGIVFGGGGDVAPANWGGERHPATEVDKERDTAEILLMRAALEADLPVLGVCRGMQVMAV